MERFQYSITRHPAESFQEVAYYCTEDGTCALEDVPVDQVTVLEEILNERGRAGWELIQVVFGKNGLLAFWKRPISP
ncbi:hypothetical protein SAMN02746041_01008 [Desulfacinum hydrothermale DSM 13146]|uniref:DUF4177 domain-containing protein n=1 Tax=Desulfacinum hydrothermale DSM 13146 TaxID=1121390 RepID=A0A1W1XA68_9BACT|nr:hypothetical protein [Desulfacinum hydrothermale]SMC20753.1 hypothetical protein SAMN02746041_01008 [Desulfacinum hydrothermale DSM 13146]